jgi:hypothetical protein
MQSELWQWVFGRMPAEQYNQIMLVTRSGIEIAVQALLRIEPEFVAIKGRLTGSTDAGRVFFIPYENLDYFGIERDVKEEEFDAIFGTGSLTAAAQPRVSARPEPAVPDPDPDPELDPSPAEATVSVTVSQKTTVPLKSEVLERFRSRSSGSANGTTLRPSTTG